MSQIFVCVIKREKHTIPPAFLEQIAQLASRSDMYVFCPPKYIEEFMRTPKYGNLLVFDLADNDEYDDCEEFYYTVDCDLQNKRIETMVHIANTYCLVVIRLNSLWGFRGNVLKLNLRTAK